MLAAYTGPILAPRVIAVSHVCDVTLGWLDGPGGARILTLIPVTHQVVLLDGDGRTVDHFELPLPELVLVFVPAGETWRAAYALTRGDVGTLAIQLTKEPCPSELHLVVESAAGEIADWMVPVSDPMWTPT